MNQNPWCESGESGTIQTSFEDNFTSASTDKLPDSKEYLEALEKKLNKLKSDSGVLKQLAERREECMEKLLSGAIELVNDPALDFDDSNRTSQIIRHIIPEQAVNSAELVHIIKHDHLAATESNEDEQSKQTDLEN